MFVVSQQHMSQLQKDVTIFIEHYFAFAKTANLFGDEIRVAEMRQASKI
jgi:hypothetical protein